MTPYKKIRLYLGLKQRQVADILGMSQPGWQQVEKGTVLLPDEKKKILHYKFGLSYKFMIEGIGEIRDKEFKSSREIIIIINGKKTSIKEHEFKEVKISVK
jgi:transcriptional regulator with XRE-family HTH domain